MIWAVIYMLGGNPEESAALWFIYTLTNCFLFASLVIYAANQFRKWDMVQTVIDVFVNTLISLMLFWLLFFQKDTSSLIAFINLDSTGVLSILTDILIDISLYSLFISVRTGKIPAFIKIIAFGLLLYTYNDIVYYYMAFNGLYYPNTIIDITYVFSLNIIAFGVTWKTRSNNLSFRLNALRNTGSQRKWGCLVVYPVFVILFSIFDWVHLKLTVNDFLLWITTIFLYWASCHYIQLSLEKEALLKQSNEQLEKRVAEQVGRLTFLSNQDALTTLFNRRYFMNCLYDTIEKIQPDDILALLVIDVDRFKAINDTLGHEIGDRVLTDLSYRIIEWNRYEATIARLGGDEFAVMFAGTYAKKDIESLSEEIIDICAKPFHIGNNSLNLSISIGIAIAPINGGDGNALIQNADIALYRAKSQGYNKYQFYDPFMSHDLKKSAEIELLLKRADLERDFELYFQPQFALPNKELIGAEALIRWKNPEHGYVPPNVFIPIAERIGHILVIGEWVMRETIKQSMKWNEQYHVPLKVSFNISPKALFRLSGP